MSGKFVESLVEDAALPRKFSGDGGAVRVKS